MDETLKFNLLKREIQDDLHAAVLMVKNEFLGQSFDLGQEGLGALLNEVFMYTRRARKEAGKDSDAE